MTAPFVRSFLQHRSPLIFTSTCNTNHGARPMAFSSNTAGGRGVLKLVTSSSGGTSTLQCNAISSTGNTEDDLSVVKRNEEHVVVVKDDGSADILVESIKHMLRSLDDREISLSPYDTAWVALVKDVKGGGGPQFPESLDWISNNQLGDGSWGDSCFLVYDRILNTLACVVALKSWNMHMHHHQINKGILFIKQNIERLENEDVDHMPSGFEVVFPSLLDMAKKLQLDIDVNSHGTSTFMKEIYAARDLKLNKIPKEVMHKVATPLLFSLEGMSDLTWDKLMKFQAGDGSFLYSPASTAYALDQTKDDKCLQYIQNCLCKFNGGVPMAYPMELYEYIWTVDRLQRLGISRYFEREIEERMEYVHRYWTNRGIGWTRNSQIPDLDDTAMGFRLLRMHGYHISPDVLENFNKVSTGEFVCFPGQTLQSVTVAYNLYRASQVKFPGENILCHAADYAVDFLMKRRAQNQLLDKWIIAKDLPGEVEYALDVPWYASLPRLEARFYLEQYGGEDDVWIGKTLYRMLNISNNTYLEFAKLDYNNCQDSHLREWKHIQRWYKDCNLEEFGISEKSALQAYNIAAASVFEPEKREERLAWAKTSILVETICSYSQQQQQQLSREEKRGFVKEFEDASILKYNKTGGYCRLVEILSETLNQLSLDILKAHGQDIHPQLSIAWHKWLKKWEESAGEAGDNIAELFVRVLNLSGCAQRKSAHMLSEELLLFHPKYHQLLETTKTVCHQLRRLRAAGDINGWATNTNTNEEEDIESNMQELTKLVLTKSTPEDLESHIKQNFLTVAKSFYYASYFSPVTISSHIDQVLFQRVL